MLPRQKKAQYMITEIVYNTMVPMNDGPNPYLTCSQPLTVGLNAQPKFHAMLVRLAMVARDDGSTCSMMKV
jgi:hypothetical protein